MIQKIRLLHNKNHSDVFGRYCGPYLFIPYFETEKMSEHKICPLYIYEYHYRSPKIKDKGNTRGVKCQSCQSLVPFPWIRPF